MDRELQEPPETYVYKFYTPRNYWRNLERQGAVSIWDEETDEGGDFQIVCFHDAEIMQWLTSKTTWTLMTGSCLDSQPALFD